MLDPERGHDETCEADGRHPAIKRGLTPPILPSFCHTIYHSHLLLPTSIKMDKLSGLASKLGGGSKDSGSSSNQAGGQKEDYLDKGALWRHFD